MYMSSKEIAVVIKFFQVFLLVRDASKNILTFPFSIGFTLNEIFQNLKQIR